MLSRSFVFVVLLSLCFCFFSISADTIVSDNYGNVVGLPLSGGNATGGYTVAGSLVRTSPYILTILINDINETNPLTNQPFPNAAHESFFMLNTFCNATLFSSSFQPSVVINNVAVPVGVPTPGPTPQFYLGNATNPNSATGLYVFSFIIPVSAFFCANISYNNSNFPTVVDQIFISVFNPVTIVGDPQFVGLRGQSYQIHGIDGAVYNIISEQDFQVNSRFVFLSKGRCPIINGVVDSNCWSHPGSYLGEMSFQAMIDGKLHRLLVVAGPANRGFAAIQMDGTSLAIGDTVTFGSFSVSYSGSHKISITSESYDFDLSNSDMFINQAVHANVPLSSLSSHGLLGQTHTTTVYPSTLRYIEGEVDDYIIGDNDIFGFDFLFNQFQA